MEERNFLGVPSIKREGQPILHRCLEQCEGVYLLSKIERLREALHTIVTTKNVNEINPQANSKMMWIGCIQIAEAALKRDE